MITCPSCKASAATNLGSIPGSNYFAGQTLDYLLPGGSLYRCDGCGLGFRDPQIPKVELDRLYRQAAPAAWTAVPGNRKDWSLARAEIERNWGANAEILDVGCFDGSFLAETKAKRRFGVEISDEGIQLAMRRGVEVLGRDFLSIPDSARSFDVITAFDVIEHVEDPRGFLCGLARKVGKGGMLIISTGDLDAASWRVARSRYWYCAIPEHISFLSRRWLRCVVASAGLDIVSISPFSHGSKSLLRRTKELVLNSAYLLAPGAVRLVRRLGAGKRDTSKHDELLDFPPAWMTARDHMLVVLRRQ